MGQDYSTEEGAQDGQQPADGTSPSDDQAQQSGTIAEGEEGPTADDFQQLSGYRVMKVFHGSPAARSGLGPFEDFIVAVNRNLVDSDKAQLAAILSENEGKEVALVVWNAIDNRHRNVILRPVKWNGPGLLGAAVRYEPIAGAADHVLRVMEVLPGSPAEESGLVADTDFIVGTPAEVFKKEGDFAKLISEALAHKTAASVMVYSKSNGKTRDVEIRPNRGWGGEGSLGCELATGLLHRITRPS